MALGIEEHAELFGAASNGTATNFSRVHCLGRVNTGMHACMHMSNVNIKLCICELLDACDQRRPQDHQKVMCYCQSAGPLLHAIRCACWCTHVYIAEAESCLTMLHC